MSRYVYHWEFNLRIAKIIIKGVHYSYDKQSFPNKKSFFYSIPIINVLNSGDYTEFLRRLMKEVLRQGYLKEDNKKGG